ncbi:hypothetical protein LIER_03742 [Lithospermum erythrorhizon]|uniref:Gag-pol polyprotein n=1 Tax=Lithospermum erythrorhizon TaxID=34254 RepID=A0AAV3NVQ3_LITER
MAGKKAYLTQICSLKGDHVTFGDGGKRKIIGKRKLNVDGLPHLTDVLLVEGLTTNLISISQLCNDGMKVLFGKEGCTVNDSCEKTVMHKTRSVDNCYMWSSVQALSCRKGEDAELWHKRLGHTNYRNIHQIISKEAVGGIPTFDIKDQVLDLGVAMNEEHINDGTPINDSWSTDKEHVADGKCVDDTCEGSRPIQLASRIQKNHPVDNIIGKIDQALKDEHWINAMQDELLQFQRNDVWELVPRPRDHNVIGTKWIFKNKSDEQDVVTRNKTRLVAQGYVRSICRAAKGFLDDSCPQHVYRPKKALYGLKQSPRAWYERLTKYLLTKGYACGGTDKTLFIQYENSKLMVAQIYVDDIIFGGTSEQLIRQFVQQMESEFEMSMYKYAKNLVKKFGLGNTKSKRTPVATHVKVNKDVDGSSVDISNYRSMIGILLYLTTSRLDISYSVGV